MRACVLHVLFLTHFPMSLLSGFMTKEERKPLRYITRGMVAMNFCWWREERERQPQT